MENHELYSGSPRRLDIRVAHKYSAAPSKNWFALGLFNSTGERKAVEQFAVPGRDVFGKYVRLEVLDNYGDEHYCTMTSFR